MLRLTKSHLLRYGPREALRSGAPFASAAKPSAPDGGAVTAQLPRRKAAFSLVEVMVVMGLVLILIVGALGGLLGMDLCSRRTADSNAVLAVVEAKVEDVRAATYNPPNSPWTSSTVYLTNNSSIALNQAGATFQVPGTVITKVEPVANGHLVTVTGTFAEARKPISVTLQTLVNKWSGGQQ